jgi:hypothetical protein
MKPPNQGERAVHVMREQIQAVLEFDARSLDAPPVPAEVATLTDARSL